MPEELTTEYTMENWQEATRNWIFMPYYVGELPDTVYMGITPEQYGRSDFERDLRKASRKRETFFGENIRDAIKTIKG